MPTNGDAIRRHRELAGFSQTTFARHLNISLGHLSKLECGHKSASPPMLKRIADALDVTVRDLTPQPEKTPTAA